MQGFVPLWIMIVAHQSDNLAMNRTLSSLGILACLLFSGCNKAGTPEKRPEPLNPGTITLTRAQQEYVNAGNTFALDITREVFAEAE